MTQYPLSTNEWPITKEQLQTLYSPIDYSVFSDVEARYSVQTDISKELHDTIEHMSYEDIFKNTVKTLEFKKHIQDHLNRIEDIIESLRKIKDMTWWKYGLYLELRIPQLEEKSKKLHDKVKVNYQTSNTHIQLSNRKKELIQQERLDIQNQMIKFLEDLREYT